jgi:tetratricopeptide (TPR) repeat protein
MKYIIIPALCMLLNTTFAQINPKNIYGTWVTSHITYRDGSELSDDNSLKYIYVKYTFSNAGKVNIATIYFEQGPDRLYEIDHDILSIKSSAGGLMNSYQIESLKDTLILLQQGANGFDDPEALKFYFVPEAIYQKSLPLKADDIFTVKDRDTIYRQSRKIYASYKGEGFQSYIYTGIKDHISMDGRAGHLAATFIVSKTGVADSVRILEGINDEFNSRFIKVFTKAKKDWKPALLNGKPVPVRMQIDLRYSTSATVIPSYMAERKAREAFYNKDYEIAIYYYDRALSTTPTDKESLYQRGMCKMLLGNKTAACEDWNKAKALGSSTTIDAMIEKYCH